MLGTHSTKTKSGLLDSCDQYTILCMSYMIYWICEWKIKSQIYVWIKSLLLLKKLDMFLLLKKMILICQNIISALWDVKKRVLWWQKFRSVLSYIKKIKNKNYFWWQKFRSVLLYIFKKDFLRRKLHSWSKFMQSWIKINTNIAIHNLFLYFNNLHVSRESYLRKI